MPDAPLFRPRISSTRAPLIAASTSLSLHAALPIWHLLDVRPDDRRVQVLLERDPAGQALVQHAPQRVLVGQAEHRGPPDLLRRHVVDPGGLGARPDRKSTRLNSSHRCISYAVFCLK